MDKGASLHSWRHALKDLSAQHQCWLCDGCEAGPRVSLLQHDQQKKVCHDIHIPIKEFF